MRVLEKSNTTLGTLIESSLLAYRKGGINTRRFANMEARIFISELGMGGGGQIQETIYRARDTQCTLEYKLGR